MYSDRVVRHYPSERFVCGKRRATGIWVVVQIVPIGGEWHPIDIYGFNNYQEMLEAINVVR